MAGDAINTLTAKRDELAAELKITKTRLAWLQDSLAHIDAALQLIDTAQVPLQITQTNNAVWLFYNRPIYPGISCPRCAPEAPWTGRNWRWQS